MVSVRHLKEDRRLCLFLEEKMKKLLGLALLGAAIQANGAVLLDTLTDVNTGQPYSAGWAGVGAGIHRNLSGDLFGAAPGGPMWAVSKATFIMRYSLGSGAINDVTLDFSLTQFTDGSTASQPHNSFSPVYGTRHFVVGTVAAPGNYVTTLDFSTSKILIDPAFLLGVQFSFFVGGLADERMTAGIRDYGTAANGGATVGTASNGVFFDQNGNGLLEYSPTAPVPVNENFGISGWTSATIGVKLEGDLVPEPASIGVLSLGFLAIAARRRK